MGNFKRPGGFGGNKGRGGFGARNGGRPGFGRPSFGGNRDDKRSEMFTATCDQCHKQCEVPFRPNGSKPVYCNNCFGSKRDGYSNDFSKRETPRHRSEIKDTFSFDSTPKQRMEDKRIDELKKQVDAISAKIDKLLNIAQGGNVKAIPAVAPALEKIAVTKTTSAAKTVMASEKKVVAKKTVSSKPAAAKKASKSTTVKPKAASKKK